MSPDLVVLGNLIVDDIVYEDGSTRLAQPGGAALYMGLTAHLWGVEIGIVTVAGQDFPSTALAALAERGADLGGIRHLDGPGLRTWLLYEGPVRRVVHRLTGASHDTASPGTSDIPGRWRPRAIHLAPMPFALQVRQVAELRRSRSPELMLSVDPFELVREGELGRWRDLLSNVDLLLFSEDEMAADCLRNEPGPFLERLCRDLPTSILYKQGARGGIACRQPAARQSRWPARAGSVVDTTGAGDAFACGVLAGLLIDRDLDRALERGIVSASFAIEDYGIEGLLAATPEQACDRLGAWFGHS